MPNVARGISTVKSPVRVCDSERSVRGAFLRRSLQYEFAIPNVRWRCISTVKSSVRVCDSERSLRGAFLR
jgi:hypothetical protein